MALVGYRLCDVCNGRNDGKPGRVVDWAVYLHENCDSTGPYPGGLKVLEMVERALKKARGE